MSEQAVVIAGGGPTGMMLAAELTLAGTDVLIVERRAPLALERAVTGCTQYDSGGYVPLSAGTLVRAQYLVGCVGGRSAVRKAAGIDFAGWDPTTRWIIAEVEMEQVP